jgi:hypothetical protein
VISNHVVLSSHLLRYPNFHRAYEVDQLILCIRANSIIHSISYYPTSAMSQIPETAQIPVIDISGVQPEAEVGQALVDAAATSGFVYVRNEGRDIPVAAIDRMFDLVNSLSKSSHFCALLSGTRG